MSGLSEGDTIITQTVTTGGAKSTATTGAAAGGLRIPGLTGGGAGAGAGGFNRGNFGGGAGAARGGN